VDSLWFYGRAPLGNLVMLIPLGFMLPWLAARWRRWWRAMTVVLATTLVIELTQLFGTLAYGFPYKRFDVDDIWLNFVGGMAGYGLYRLTERLLAAHKAQRPGEADRTSAVP
jgi:glycopeptide antibiotics resistance protein